jgi:O-antigen ligase
VRHFNPQESAQVMASRESIGVSTHWPQPSSSRLGPRLHAWLVVCVAGLYLLFPTLTNASNLFLLLLLLTLPLLLWSAERRQALLREPLVWVLLALYLVILVGIAYSPAGADWVADHLRKYARLLYAALLVAILLHEPRLQRIALAAFVAAMGFTLLSTWLNIWFLLPWSESQALGWGESHHVFGDHITQNVMMALFAVVVLDRAWERGSRDPWAWLLAGVAVLAVLSITHLSAGRTGFVVMVAALAAWVLVRLRGHALWVGGLLLALGLVALFVSADGMQARFASALAEARAAGADPHSSIGHRLLNYRTTWALFLESPWVGHGTGAYHVEICRHIEPPGDCAPFNVHPHNDFLFLAANHGILGFGLYVGILSLLLVAAARCPNHSIRAVLIAFVAISIINSLLNSALWSSRHSQSFAYMAALLYVQARSAAALRRASAG